MNYRLKLFDVLNQGEISAVKKFTAVPNASIDNLTVGELRELRGFLTTGNSSITGKDAIDALNILIDRFKAQYHV